MPSGGYSLDVAIGGVTKNKETVSFGLSFDRSTMDESAAAGQFVCTEHEGVLEFDPNASDDAPGQGRLVDGGVQLPIRFVTKRISISAKRYTTSGQCTLRSIDAHRLFDASSCQGRLVGKVLGPAPERKPADGANEDIPGQEKLMDDEEDGADGKDGGS